MEKTNNRSPKISFRKRKKVKHAKFPDFTDFLTYIPSRKQVYVPEYHNLIKDNPVLTELKTDETTSYVVYDFDGPRTEDGEPTFEKVTLEMLIDKLNDPRHPFGHGYIVAAAIAGIDIKKYIYKIIRSLCLIISVLYV